METWEEVSSVDEKQLTVAVNKLSNLATIREIARLAHTQFDCTLALCTSSVESEAGKIQFILYRDKQPDLLSVSELSVSIQNVIDYEEVMIHPATLFSKETLNKQFKDLTPVDDKHLQEIQGFLKKNYAKFIQASPKFSRFSFFPQEISSSQQLDIEQIQRKTYEAFTQIYDSIPNELHNNQTAAIILRSFIDSALQHTSDNQQMIEDVSSYILSSRPIKNA